jgi:hypothetical protein
MLLHVSLVVIFVFEPEEMNSFVWLYYGCESVACGTASNIYFIRNLLYVNSELFIKKKQKKTRHM